MIAPLILLTNDDGHATEGIRALREALSTFAEVHVVAPEVDQSMASHSLTFHRPLRARRVEERIFAVDGTPVDCAYIGLHARGIVPRRPDLVVSGINHGANLGQDVIYSGTVAAAREAALSGVSAIAASSDRDGDFARAAAFCARLAQKLHRTAGERARPLLLNVNFPRGWRSGARATRLGQCAYDDAVEVRADPRGRDYLWLGGAAVRHVPDPGSDTGAHAEGIASVTSLLLDASGDVAAHAGLLDDA
jgi:5'-nucleotidase